MNRKSLQTITVIILVATFAAGCTLPIPQLGQQATPTGAGATPDTVYTQAVQTVAAQLTQAAASAGTNEPGGVTAEPTQPEATQSPAPESTPTQPAPTAGPTLEQATKAPTVEATAAPTQPAATATVASGDPRAGLGEPVLRDTFANEENWPFEEDEHSLMEVNKERLEMTAFKADGFDSWALTWPNPTDFYVEMTVTTGKCAGLDRYGIMFRGNQKATTGYLFGISCDGKYSLRLWNGKKYTRLVDWTASNLIKAGPDQSNRIGVKGVGDSFSLYVNGSLLTTVEDDTYDKGFTGVFIASRETKNYKVFVDEYVIWELKE